MRALSWVGGVVVVLLLGCFASSAGAIEFVPLPGSPYATTDPPLGASSVGSLGGEASGDFNDDGITDVAIVDETGVPVRSPGESVSVLLGTRSGGLTLAPGSPFALYSGGEWSSRGPIVAADFNGDGKLDLAVVDVYHRTVSIFLGTGTGEFRPYGSPIPYSGATEEVPSIVTGDFTGNGVQDLALATNQLTVLLGNGAGGFSPAPRSPFALPTWVHSLVAGDFNADGRTDLAMTLYTDQLAVYLSNGAGGFTQAPGSPYTTGEDPSGIATGDLTGNGKLDLATANTQSGNVTVLMGNGAGGFASAEDSPFAVPAHLDGMESASEGLPKAIAIGDFGCDRRADLAVANWNGSSNNVAILEGNGRGDFTNVPGSPIPAGINPEELDVGDFNGDGRPDLAIDNPFGGTLTVLQNTTPATTCEPPNTEKPGGSSTPPGLGQGGSEAPVAPLAESLSVAVRMIRAGHGFTLDFTLARPASVVVRLEKTVMRKLDGRWRRTLELIGASTIAGHAGLNRVWIRRIAGYALTHGRYTISVYTEVGSVRSATRSVGLIVRR